MLVQSSKHINERLKQQKRKIALSKENPLVLVLSEDFIFLNQFTLTILKLNQYPFIIRQANGKQLMNYILPLISYEDTILSKEGLVQFLCDIAFSNLEIVEYLERKQNIKKIYKNWFQIFHNDEGKIVKNESMYLLRKDDLSNNIYKQLIALSRDIINKGYQRVFESYRQENINPEAIILVDITETILKNCKTEKVDYVLRGDFSLQIDYAQKYKIRIQSHPEPLRMEEDAINFILLDEKIPVQKHFPLFSVNMKWFSGVVVGLAFIFGKWAH